MHENRDFGVATGADKMTNGKPTGLWRRRVCGALWLQAGYDVEVITPEGGSVPIDERSTSDKELVAI